MARQPRIKGSVPNVRRALAEGQAGRATRAASLNKQRAGTVGTGLKKANRERGLRGPGNQ